VPVERLRERALLDPVLGDLILRAYVLRREFLIGLGAGLKIVGSRFSPDARGSVSSPRATGCRTAGSMSRRTLSEALLHSLGVAPTRRPS
jgi:thioredoxin reductase (NADPH)